MNYLISFSKPVYWCFFLVLFSCTSSNSSTWNSDSSPSNISASSLETQPMPSGPELISEVQQLLLTKNYNPGPVDGIMGQRTASAIEEFQSDNNITLTGSIDEATYYTLKGIYEEPTDQQQTNETAGLIERIGSQFFSSVLAGAGIELPPDRNNDAAHSDSAYSGTSPNSSNPQDPEQQESQSRSDHLFNNDIVTFQTECPGLFIPYIGVKMFQEVIPVYAMQVINESDRRYSVKYDMLHSEEVERFTGTFESTPITTKSFTIRPNSRIETTLIRVNPGSGERVTSMNSIEVFECTSP